MIGSIRYVWWFNVLWLAQFDTFDSYNVLWLAQFDTFDGYNVLWLAQFATFDGYNVLWLGQFDTFDGLMFCDWLNSIRLMVIMFCDWLNSLGLMVLMLCDSHELCSFFYISIYLHLLYILISIYIDQFYCWRKPEDPEKTTYLSQVTDRHDITEILLIVALNTIKPN